MNGGTIIFLAVSLFTLLKGSIICRIVSAVLFALGILEVYLGIKYSRNIIRKGTDNGFAPLAMASSLFIGIALIVAGVVAFALTF